MLQGHEQSKRLLQGLSDAHLTFMTLDAMATSQESSVQTCDMPWVMTAAHHSRAYSAARSCRAQHCKAAKQMESDKGTRMQGQRYVLLLGSADDGKGGCIGVM